MSTHSSSRRAPGARPPAPAFRRGLVAAASAALFLAACGGGGGASHTGASGLSQDQVESDAGNASQLGNHSASTFDNLFDTTQIVTSAAAQGATADGVVVNCAGGGTATITITGGTLATQLNGQFDAGEHYTVQFAQCRGQLDYAQLDGTMDMDIVSVAVSPAGRTIQAALTLESLKMTLPVGTLALGGQADFSRTVADGDNGATTTTSELTSSELTAKTTFHGRAATFDLTNVDFTRVVNKVNGIATGSTFSGDMTIAGSADGFQFKNVEISTDSATTYDVDGNPLNGAWTAVHGDTTIHVGLSGGIVTVQLDRGSDGTIDRTWTFPLQHLIDAEG